MSLALPVLVPRTTAMLSALCAGHTHRCTARGTRRPRTGRGCWRRCTGCRARCWGWRRRTLKNNGMVTNGLTFFPEQAICRDHCCVCGDTKRTPINRPRFTHKPRTHTRAKTVPHTPPPTHTHTQACSDGPCHYTPRAHPSVHTRRPQPCPHPMPTPPHTPHAHSPRPHLTVTPIPTLTPTPPTHPNAPHSYPHAHAHGHTHAPLIPCAHSEQP